MADTSTRLVLMGRIAGAYGIKGWVKVISDASPIDNILSYPVWRLARDGDWKDYKVLSGRTHGKGLVARLEGVDDRDEAQAMKGMSIAVERDQLPAAAQGEYYWVDLQGLSVHTLEGVDLGKVDHLFETGANDVLVVKGDKERLIPYISDQVIKSVDLQKGLMVVDWDPEF